MNLETDLVELFNNHIYVHSTYESLGSDEWAFGFVIDFLPKESQLVKRRTPHMQTYSSFSLSGGASYVGAWETPIEALKEGIKYAKNHVLPLTVD